MNITFPPRKRRISRTKLTSTGLLEVSTAVPQLQTGMVAVARFIVEILDDGIDGGLLHDAGGIPAGTAELRLPAAAALHAGPEEGDHPDQQQPNTHDCDRLYDVHHTNT